MIAKHEYEIGKIYGVRRLLNLYRNEISELWLEYIRSTDQR